MRSQTRCRYNLSVLDAINSPVFGQGTDRIFFGPPVINTAARCECGRLVQFLKKTCAQCQGKKVKEKKLCNCGCYRVEKDGKCQTCGKDIPYQSLKKKPCKTCGSTKKVGADNLCRPCRKRATGGGKKKKKKKLGKPWIGLAHKKKHQERHKKRIKQVAARSGLPASSVQRLSRSERTALWKPYSDRAKLCRDLGFKTYAEYLASDLWRTIRHRVLGASAKCIRCGSAAVQVHHSAYTKQNLSGASVECLHSVCRACHQQSEVRPDGSKRTLDECNAELRIGMPLGEAVTGASRTESR